MTGTIKKAAIFLLALTFLVVPNYIEAETPAGWTDGILQDNTPFYYFSGDGVTKLPLGNMTDDDLDTANAIPTGKTVYFDVDDYSMAEFSTDTMNIDFDFIPLTQEDMFFEITFHDSSDAQIGDKITIHQDDDVSNPLQYTFPQIDNINQVRINAFNNDGNNLIEINEIQFFEPANNPQSSEIFITLITPYSFTVNWTDTGITSSITHFEIGWYEQGVGNWENYNYETVEKNFVDGVQSFRIPGPLKPDTYYHVRVASKTSLVSEIEPNPPIKTVRTLSENENIRINIGATQLIEFAQANITEWADIGVFSEGYKNVKVSVNGVIVGDLQPFDPYQYNLEYIPLDDYLPHVVNGVNTLTVNLTNNLDEQEVKSYLFYNSVDDPDGPDRDPYNPEAPVKPTPPDPPDSSWDVVGWLSYIANWIIYLTDSAVWVFGQATSSIYKLFSNAEQFFAFLAGFFDFLPPEIVTLMVLGMAMAVLLRVLGR